MSKPGSLSEVLNTIAQGAVGRKSHVNCSWPSNLSLEVLKKLYKEGYIRGFVCSQASCATILLKFGQRPLDIKSARKASQRVWVGVEDLRRLPCSLGNTAFLSTSKGVLTLNEAIKLRCGGELLFSLKT